MRDTNLTPFECNGGQLDNGFFLVGCDYLVITYHGDISYTHRVDEFKQGNWLFIKQDYGTKHFEFRHDLYYKKERIGQILSNPRNPAIPIETVQLKIENQHFYMKSGLKLQLKLLKDEIGLEFHNISRADLYIDFQRFANGMSFDQFIDSYTLGQLHCKGKSTEFNVYNRKVNGEMVKNGFSFGSRMSDKYVRCYNKTNELELSGKDYIRRYWQANGADFSKGNIYRFEIELKSKFFKKLIGQNELGIIENGEFNLLNIESIIPLINLATNNYFDFVVQDKSVIRNDDKLPVMLFDWQNLLEGAKRVYTYVKKKLVHKSFTIRQKFIVMRNLFREYIMKEQDPYYLEGVVKIMKDYFLQYKWDIMYWKYLKEFRGMCAIYYDYDHTLYQKQYNGLILKLRQNGSN